MANKLRYFYDVITGKYRYDGGRTVPEQYIRNAVMRDSINYQQQMRELSIALKNNEIGLQDWYDGMRRMMKASYRNAIDAAKGPGAFTAQERGYFGRMMREQYQYLNNFANQIKSGAVELDGRFVARAGMYGDQANTMHQNWNRLKAWWHGYKEERRVLGFAEHCHTRGDKTGCVELAARGWVPIGTLPRIGDSPCIARCRCHFEYRKGPRKAMEEGTTYKPGADMLFAPGIR
jgi:hypothetical protein